MLIKSTFPCAKNNESYLPGMQQIIISKLDDLFRWKRKSKSNKSLTTKNISKTARNLKLIAINTHTQFIEQWIGTWLLLVKLKTHLLLTQHVLQYTRITVMRPIYSLRIQQGVVVNNFAPFVNATHKIDYIFLILYILFINKLKLEEKNFIFVFQTLF